MSIAIKVENLSKAYQLGNIGTGTISRDLERWLAQVRGKDDPFLKIGEENQQRQKSGSNIVWSLKDINFEVQQGDAIGIVGRNGAGKSTLLKILSKVTAPTKGRIQGTGRIASLLEVGTGFHPELSGRENIFLNGAILGMRKKEIANRLDEIVDFAGIERYLDTPVKRYSSGMYVRLAFAVAAHLESEILIVDEVLAVGDVEFQKKCLGKMGEVSKGEGKTVLFVSHNMPSIKALCQKGILLNNGEIQVNGDINHVVSSYFNIAETTDGQFENSIMHLLDFGLFGENSAKLNRIFNGQETAFKIRLNIKKLNPNVGFCIAIYNAMQELVVSINTYHIAKEIEALSVGEHELVIPLAPYILTDGQYFINLHINTKYGEIYKIIENCGNLFIVDDGNRRGGNLFKGEWPGQISLVPEISINSY